MTPGVVAAIDRGVARRDGSLACLRPRLATLLAWPKNAGARSSDGKSATASSKSGSTPGFSGWSRKPGYRPLGNPD
jgi:hypothetical protein